MFHLDHRISWYFIFSTHWHFRSKPKDCCWEQYYSVWILQLMDSIKRYLGGTQNISPLLPDISSCFDICRAGNSAKDIYNVGLCRLQRRCIAGEALKILTLSKGEGQTGMIFVKSFLQPKIPWTTTLINWLWLGMLPAFLAASVADCFHFGTDFGELSSSRATPQLSAKM